MSIPVNCRFCGYRGTSRAIHIENAGGMSVGDVSESCPRCGGMADLASGTYDIVGAVITAVRKTPRKDIDQFRHLIESVKAGTKTKDDAENQISELGHVLVALWKIANKNAANFSLIVSVLALYLQITSSWSADATAEKLQASVEKQTEVLQMQTQIEQMILSDLRKRPGGAAKRVELSFPTSTMIAPSLPRKPIGEKPSNRFERRKAAASKRKP